MNCNNCIESGYNCFRSPNKSQPFVCTNWKTQIEPILALDTTSIQVTARTRRLRANWTLEAPTQLVTSFSEEAVNEIGRLIAEEIDRDILESFREEAEKRERLDNLIKKDIEYLSSLKVPRRIRMKKK
jgi:hypothetical protein